jgi:uncharacterized protein
MSRDFPDWVHPDKAAAARREFAGTVPLDRMPRLDGLVVDQTAGEISFRLAFSHDEQRQVRVEVHVAGMVPMQCQRTLKTFMQEVNSESVVGVVVDEQAASGLPDDYEPKLCADNRLKLLELIEEEVLLGLPLVPVDPGSERMSDENDSVGQETHRPFEVLATLKRNKRDRN